MKQIFTALIVFSCSYSRAQVFDENYGYVQKQLIKKNKIKLISGWTFSFSSTGELVKDGRRSSFEKFDKNGNRTELVYFDAFGNSSYECTYSYDEKGTETTRISYQTGKCTFSKWSYTYIDETRVVQRKPFKSYSNKEMWEFVFDNNKNCVEELYYDGDGLFSGKKAFGFDSGNNMSVKKVYDAYGSLLSSCEYIYDNNTKQNIEQIFYDNAANILYKQIMRYDSKGDLTAKFLVDKDGNTTAITVYLYLFSEN